MPMAHAVLSRHHLSDHPAGATALEPCLTPGTALGPLLILERLEVGSKQDQNASRVDKAFHLTIAQFHLGAWLLNKEVDAFMIA